ncbi:probable protein phosphatase 2C 55 [Phalaenopsis equestris]|uniref:probable protein phosphatase 2C 55 n=1 Tax=Phalaenopsis equestris TaxID=78828 RepID=UPI0009E5623F|nr:probable protein phosphatase 2C 55 [Phalaenopsis equestris]
MSACSYVTGRMESISPNICIGDKTNAHLQAMNRTGICNKHKFLDHYRIINGGLPNKLSNDWKLSYWSAWSGSSEFCSKFVPCFALWNKNFQLAYAAQYSTGAARNFSFDGVSQDEQLESRVVMQNRKSLSDRSLKLFSGSCYLPHPDKEETGGEDAHFLCDDEQVIGVADGVGGWADLGVDAGKYAKELMANAASAIQDEPKGLINPLRVLEKAYSCTKSKGSSTACIIALTNQGIHAVNLGDSGFIVVREGCTIFRSPIQQHDFNFTYQLESDNGSDLPSSAQVFTFPVEAGDVIVAGTDGLFDNLYNTDINAIVVHAMRARLGPQVTAQKIAALARQRAQDKNRQTPFSTAAQDAGYRYYGGKPDDITVIVSYITSNTA